MNRSSTSWRKKFRRRLAACAIGGSAALSSAQAYAANAFDNASDPVYADGWQAGDNGGFGFTPWSFDAGYIFQGTNYTYARAGFKMIDDGLKGGTQFSNPFNDIGRAWTIGTQPEDDGAPHVGRGFDPLQIGQRLKVVFDNPTRRQFFKGYFIRLNGLSEGVHGNICNNGNSCTFPLGGPVPKMGFDRFEYFNNGEWFVDDVASTPTGVFDFDTAEAGALFQVTRTGADAYDFLVTLFGSGSTVSASRQIFNNPGVPVDWIEFVFFNPASNTETPPSDPTDFYIRSMEIIGRPGDANFDGNVNGDDYFLIDKGFAQGLQGYENGDFDGDGTIGADDYFIIDSAFASGPAAIAAVPEPTSMLVLGFGCIVLAHRRRFHAGRRASGTIRRP